MSRRPIIHFHGYPGWTVCGRPWKDRTGQWAASNPTCGACLRSNQSTKREIARTERECARLEGYLRLLKSKLGAMGPLTEPRGIKGDREASGRSSDGLGETGDASRTGATK